MKSKNRGRMAPRALLASLALCVVTGCATTHNNPDDPLEGYNRAVFAFNDTVDKIVLRPVAKAYDTVTPLPVRAGVGNFFGNIEDLWTGANNVMQGKIREAMSDFGRVLINSTVGILGVFDIASEMGLEQHSEDFGQTLGRWGVGEGAYFVLPIFGPRTIRDSAGLFVDSTVTGSWTGNDPTLKSSSSILRVIDTRASLLAVDRVLDQGALDRYTYVREAYLQRRRYEVYDGRPPRDPEDAYLSSLTPGLSAERSTVVAVASVNRIELASVNHNESPGVLKPGP